MAFLRWRGKVYSFSVPWLLAGIIAAVAAVVIWLGGR
jgi:hypothetical protein